MQNLVLFGFYELLSLALLMTHGHFHGMVIAVAFGFLTASFFLVFRFNQLSKTAPSQRNHLLFSLIIFSQILLALKSNQMIYIEVPSSIDTLNTFLVIAFVSTLLLLAVRTKISVNSMGAIALFCLFLAAWQVPSAAPHPFIDVFVNNTEGVNFLLNDLNPYQQSYVDIYNNAYDYHPGFLYFPGLLYVIAPFKFIFGDIRYANITGHFLAAALLVVAARRHTVDSKTPWLLGIVWASLPIQYFVFEQAWSDPILVGLAAVAFWSLIHRNAQILQTTALSLLFAVKQYAFFPAFFSLIPGIFSEPFPFRKSIRKAIGIGLLFVILMSPFLIWDGEALYSMTIANQANPKPRLDAFNMTAYFARKLAFDFNEILRISTTLIGVGLGVWIIYSAQKRKNHLSFAAIPAACLIAYGFAFFFGKWAFCNYHYFLLSFIPWIWLDFLSAATPERQRQQLTSRST